MLCRLPLPVNFLVAASLLVAGPAIAESVTAQGNGPEAVPETTPDGAEPQPPVELPPPLPGDEEPSVDGTPALSYDEEQYRDPAAEYPDSPAVLFHAGESLPWSQFGAIVHTGAKRGQPWFFGVGGGKFKARNYLHASEEMDIEVTTRSASAGMQWQALASFFAARASLGFTTFSGSFTQRGTDVAGNPSASEFLGSGFDGYAAHSAFAAVLTGTWGAVRYEFVPVGFRFTLARKIDQDLPTNHKVGLLRYTGGNTVFGIVNFAAGVEF